MRLRAAKRLFAAIISLSPQHNHQVALRKPANCWRKYSEQVFAQHTTNDNTTVSIIINM
jgi:hypothetical protein